MNKTDHIISTPERYLFSPKGYTLSHSALTLNMFEMVEKPDSNSQNHYKLKKRAGHVETLAKVVSLPFNAGQKDFVKNFFDKIYQQVSARLTVNEVGQEGYFMGANHIIRLNSSSAPYLNANIYELDKSIEGAKWRLAVSKKIHRIEPEDGFLDYTRQIHDMIYHQLIE